MRNAILLAAASFGMVVLCGCSKSGVDAASRDAASSVPTASGVRSGDTASSVPTPAPPSPFVRPVFVSKSGGHFRWEQPEDWTPTENSSGVTMQSADGKLIVNNLVLVGNPGQTDPWSFIANMLSAGAGIRDIQLVSSKDEPSQPSAYPGVNWTIQSFEFTFTDPGLGARKAAATVGICNAFGGYSALYQAFSTPPDKYDEGKTWLPLLAESVKSTNPSTMADQDKVQLAQNHPADNSALMSSWQARRDSWDRIDQKRHEARMGYERMYSPINGQYYNMPFENYDGTMHGYRDPADRNQILTHARPGE